MTTIHMPPKFQPGTEWDSADALKHQVSLYAISEGFPTYIQHRSKTQFDMRCKNEGCTWRVYASRYDEPCFVVKILVDEHKNCPGVGLKNIAAVLTSSPILSRPNSKRNPITRLARSVKTSIEISVSTSAMIKRFVQNKRPPTTSTAPLKKGMPNSLNIWKTCAPPTLEASFPSKRLAKELRPGSKGSLFRLRPQQQVSHDANHSSASMELI